MRRTLASVIACALGVGITVALPATGVLAAEPEVTFHLGNGDPNVIAEAANGAVAIPAAPTWTDHVFAGWYTTATPTEATRGRGDAPAASGSRLTGIAANTDIYARWIADSSTSPNVRHVTTRSGSVEQVLGYSVYSGVELITRQGAAVDPSTYVADGANPIFKDLNGNGALDAYEDWTLTTEQRAANLADLLATDPDGVQQIAGLMLYSAHQRSWTSPLPTQDQITFLLNDDLRHVLVAGSAAGTAMNIHAEWNNAVQSIVEGLGYGIPANNSSDPRHSTSSTSNVEYYSANEGVSKWPSSLGMAATFDVDLNKVFGKVASAEYRAMGIATALSPQIDIATDPRWSRFNGTFGEDPKLASAMSRSYVDGFQTTYANTDSTTAGVYDPISNDATSGSWGLQSVNAMMKHWPGGGAGEAGRDAHYNYGKYAVFPGGNWEAHLIPFVDGSLSLEDGTEMATAVMPYYTVSYLQTPGSLPNDSNTEAAALNMANAYNSYMLNGVLRDSYEFDGVVCTDWNVVGPKTAVDNSFDGDIAGMIWGVDDHYAQYEGIDTDGSYTNMAARARMLLDAGVDQFGGLNTTAPIVKAYDAATAADKVVLLAQMRDSAYRLLKNIFRTGLFEDSYLDPDETKTTVGQQDFMEAGYEAQLGSMVLGKNKGGLLPLDKDATSVYVPGLNAAGVTLLETYFGGGNVYTDAEDASNADVAIAFMSSVSAGGGSRNATAHTNTYTPVNLDYKNYTAANARTTSYAGEPLRDGAGNAIGQANRSYKGKTTAVAAATTNQLTQLAQAKASGKPVIVVFDTSRPSVLTEIEPNADAILFSFASQRSAVLDMLVGETSHTGTARAVHPTGLLPLQFPRDMTEVETQNEDVPRDMIPYTDSEGNAYDFGFGLTWASGQTARVDASVNPGYTAFVEQNQVPMAMPLNTGTNTTSEYSILNRVNVVLDYGYKEAATDKTNRQITVVVTAGDPVERYVPTRAGHTFSGWYTASGLAYDPAAPITADTTLTAYWDGATPAVNTVGLRQVVATAKALNPDSYTASSYAAVKAAIAAAEALLAAAASPASAQVQAAADTLNAAVARLVAAPVEVAVPGPTVTATAPGPTVTTTVAPPGQIDPPATTKTKANSTIKLSKWKLSKAASVKVTVTAPGVSPVTGKVKVTWTKGKKAVTKTYTLKKGSVTVKVPAKVKSGIWKMRTAYTGSASVASTVSYLSKVRKIASRGVTIV
ncbi:MAG: glycoside hydrolase family 3 C-terminal domain-containing protein [Bifidobacteriaceae bacterium]|jgi:beta-glucosidase|nr:glycoside hydrolase family 3 C-terminal domain-containing protein [Bifidobacteriaceae bacterium]